MKLQEAIKVADLLLSDLNQLERDLSHVLSKEVRAYVIKKIEATTAEYDELMKKDVLL